MLARQITAQWRRFLVRRDIQAIEKREFSVLSSNCIGGRIYDVLGLPYLTPTVGLFLFPDCFLKFAANALHYVQQPLKQAKHSMYVSELTYPVATIDDVEIHFLHYGSFSDAADKWIRRSARINFEQLYLSMTDRDGFEQRHERMFDELPIEAKVLFSCRPRASRHAVTILEQGNSHHVGDLYTHYEAFYRNFSFSRWINVGGSYNNGFHQN